MLQAASPEVLAARGEAISGTVPLGAMRRLAQVVSDSLTECTEAGPEGWRDVPVSAELRFGYTRAGGSRALPAVEGRTAVVLPLACDRCLGLLQQAVTAEFEYVFAETEAEAESLDGYDAWVADERGIRPLDLIEEELLLALPLARTHGADCGGTPGEEDGASAEVQRPFRALGALIGGKDEKEG